MLDPHYQILMLANVAELWTAAEGRHTCHGRWRLQENVLKIMRSERRIHGRGPVLMQYYSLGAGRHGSRFYWGEG